MTITFPGTYTKNLNFGITFHAKVDGKVVQCHITQEALQDISPDNRFDDVTEQFESHRFLFQRVAESKILSGDIRDGQVYITTADVF